MAHDAIKWAFQQGGISASAKAVLVALAYDVHASKRLAWPSVDRIGTHTHLSRATVQRALKELQEAGLIQREERTGMTTTYRLALDFPKGPHHEAPPKVGKSVGGPHTEAGGPHHEAGGPHHEAQEENKKSKKKEEKSKAGGVPPANGTKEKSKVKLPKGMSVADVVAAAKEEYSALTDEQLLAVSMKNGKYTVAALTDLWRKAHGKYVEGMLPAVTGKQQGQLRIAYTKVGNTIPAVILAVLKDWPAFVARVKSETSAYNHPSKPDIGYFAQHAVTAVNLVLAKQTEGEKPLLKTLEEVKKAGPPPAPEKLQPVAKQSPGKVTLDDLNDVMSDL